MALTAYADLRELDLISLDFGPLRRLRFRPTLKNWVPPSAGGAKVKRGCS